MPRTVSVTTYGIEELEGAARERARDWHRQHGMHEAWYDHVFEDFKAIAKCLGLTLAGTEGTPAIYFRGFSYQGQGASFEGSYRHRARSTQAIREHAPADTALHAIADALDRVQARFGNGLAVEITKPGRGEHEYMMECEVRQTHDDGPLPDDTAQEAISEQMRALARWLYAALESTWEAETADEAVDEDLEMNDVRFTADGRVFSR